MAGTSQHSLVPLCILSSKPDVWHSAKQVRKTVQLLTLLIILIVHLRSTGVGAQYKVRTWRLQQNKYKRSWDSGSDHDCNCKD